MASWCSWRCFSSSNSIRVANAVPSEPRGAPERSSVPASTRARACPRSTLISISGVAPISPSTEYVQQSA